VDVTECASIAPGDGAMPMAVPSTAPGDERGGGATTGTRGAVGLGAAAGAGSGAAESFGVDGGGSGAPGSMGAAALRFLGVGGPTRNPPADDAGSGGGPTFVGSPASGAVVLWLTSLAGAAAEDAPSRGGRSVSRVTASGLGPDALGPCGVIRAGVVAMGELNRSLERPC
jgi:hypothetical protein